MILSHKANVAGTSLIEATIAAATSALFLASLFATNMSAMKTIRTAREAAAASQILQQRVESLRIANWHQVTDADWVRTNLLGTDALTLVPYDSESTATTQIVRSATGTTMIVSRNSALLTEHAMKVIWTVVY